MDNEGYSMGVVPTTDDAMVGLVLKSEYPVVRDSAGFTSAPRTRLSLPIRPSSRRQSLSAGDRRPLRSSPLAGPALSNQSSIWLEADCNMKEPEGLDTWVSTSPSLANSYSLPSPPRKGLVRRSTTDPAPHLFHTASAPLLSPKRVAFQKASTSHRAEPPSDPLPPSPSLTLPEPIPALTRGDNSSFPLGDGPSRYDCAPLIKSTSPSPTTRSPVIHTKRVSTSLDLSENWMTANTYEITPRFSRLGISASTVILPVSARKYKRASRRNAVSGPSKSSSLPSTLISRPRPATKHPSPSLQSLALTAANVNSAGSSRETLAFSSPCSSAPSVISSSDIGTVADDSEEMGLTSSFSETDESPVLKTRSPSALRHTISFHYPSQLHELHDIVSQNSTDDSCLELEIALQQEVGVVRSENANLAHNFHPKKRGKFGRLWKKFSSVGRRAK